MSYIVVLGGGYAGQLVQLAIPNARIFDWRKTAPSHHLSTRVGPQYLWEPIPGVPSRSFPVTTLVDHRPPTADAIRAYKRKIGKEEDGGNWDAQFRHQTTGWHSELPVPRIEYNRSVLSIELQNHRLIMQSGVQINYDVLLSTIPLNVFMNLCDSPPPIWTPLRSRDIFFEIKDTNGVVPDDGIVLDYLSHPAIPYYRHTEITGREFFESLSSDKPSTLFRISPGKLYPNEESEHVLKGFATQDVYCFGRFATWRPDELAHETWQHVVRWKEESIR